MKKKTLFRFLLGVLLSTWALAQDNNSAAPIYPATPHPEQQPQSSNQDAAPQQMNQSVQDHKQEMSAAQL